MDDMANAIKDAVTECGFIPLRIDDESFNGRIGDEIVAKIRQSKFIVADFTAGFFESGNPESYQARGGAYWEAGFAAGLGLDVIYTCQENQLENIHFDTKQFNHLPWSDPPDLKAKLINRIQATIPGV